MSANPLNPYRPGDFFHAWEQGYEAATGRVALIEAPSWDIPNGGPDSGGL